MFIIDSLLLLLGSIVDQGVGLVNLLVEDLPLLQVLLDLWDWDLDKHTSNLWCSFLWNQEADILKDGLTNLILHVWVLLVTGWEDLGSSHDVSLLDWQLLHLLRIHLWSHWHSWWSLRSSWLWWHSWLVHVTLWWHWHVWLLSWHTSLTTLVSLSLVVLAVMSSILVVTSSVVVSTSVLVSTSLLLEWTLVNLIIVLHDLKELLKDLSQVWMG